MKSLDPAEAVVLLDRVQEPSITWAEGGDIRLADEQNKKHEAHGGGWLAKLRWGGTSSAAWPSPGSSPAAWMAHRMGVSRTTAPHGTAPAAATAPLPDAGRTVMALRTYTLLGTGCPGPLTLNLIRRGMRHLNV